MNIRTIVLCTTWLTLVHLSSISQNSKIDPPKPGESMPDIVFSDIRYYSKKSARLSDFRGKWLILDVWSTGCIACFRSFPKVNELQKKMGSKLQFILVGPKDTNAMKAYERFSKHYSMNLPVAYHPDLFSLFDITATPRIFAIDPAGKFHGELELSDIDGDLLTRLTSATPPVFQKYIDEGIRHYYPDMPDRAMRYSRLERTRPGQVAFIPEFEWPYHWSVYNKHGIAFRGAPLTILFRIAFFGKFFFDPFQGGWYGKYSPNVLFEGVDSSVLEYDLSSYKNMFDYTFMVGDSTIGSQQLQELVQDDLNQQFPFVVSNEWRMTPYYRVSIPADKGKKLCTRGGEPYYPSPPGKAVTGLSLRNVSITHLFYFIYNYHQLDTLFIDETGIADNVDLELDAILTDRESIKQGLRKLGFAVDLQYKRMHTLVFRPRNSGDQANRK